MLADEPVDAAVDLLAAVQRLREADARLMALPVLIVLAAGERAIDAGRRDFEAISLLDRILAIEDVRDAARQLLAVGKVELAGSATPPVIRMRTSASPCACASGSINFVSAAMSAKSSCST